MDKDTPPIIDNDIPPPIEKDTPPTIEKDASPTTEKALLSSPELTFRFTQYDIGNSDLVTIEGSTLAFSLVTLRNFRGTNKSTTLRFYDADGNGAPGGVLDWKNKTIEVLGESKPWTGIKTKPGGALSLTREWMWLGKKYTTGFKNGDYTVKLGSKLLATLTPLRTHTFSKDELATLTFHSEIPKPEMLFLIFAIIFGTLQLPPRKKPLTAAAAAGEVTVSVAAGVAADAAVNAAFSCCCTIQ